MSYVQKQHNKYDISYMTFAIYIIYERKHSNMISHFFFIPSSSPHLIHFPHSVSTFLTLLTTLSRLPPPSSGVISYLNAHKVIGLSVGKVKHFDNMTKMFFKHIISSY